jgi:RNA polymerase sigma-70 factor, ECF subfamily
MSAMTVETDPTRKVRGAERDGDDRLVDRISRGDEVALREAMTDHGRMVLGMARRIAVDPVIAEEVTQDVFVALWKTPTAFDSTRGGLRTFLVGIARNKAIDAVRRQETHLRALRRVTPIEEADTSVERADDRDLVRRCLARLTARQREALVLAYFEGYTYREVAAKLGVPEGTAKTRLHDGLAKLRVLLAAASV